MRVSESTKNWLGKLAHRYNESLTPEAAIYLGERGIEKEAVSSFLLGTVTDPDPLHEPYRGRLCLPFVTPTGVVSLRFRCLEDHDCSVYKKTVDKYHAKYEGIQGDETRLYNVQALHDADTVVGISEGELDGLVGTISGIPTVGIPGGNNFKSHYYRLFEDFERVLIFGDGDSAGRKFAAELARNIPGGEAKVLPVGLDVSSFVLKEGREAFRQFALD